jgi:F0F1-type ATP synthase alpha subunit
MVTTATGLTRQISTTSDTDSISMFNNSDVSISEKVAIAENYKPAYRGQLQMIIGPMFAGKSTELLRRMDRHKHSGMKCLYVKYKADTRYGSDAISTHDL